MAYPAMMKTLRIYAVQFGSHETTCGYWVLEMWLVWLRNWIFNFFHLILIEISSVASGICIPWRRDSRGFTDPLQLTHERPLSLDPRLRTIYDDYTVFKIITFFKLSSTRITSFDPTNDPMREVGQWSPLFWCGYWVAERPATLPKVSCLGPSREFGTETQACLTWEVKLLLSSQKPVHRVSWTEMNGSPSSHLRPWQKLFRVTQRTWIHAGIHL